MITLGRKTALFAIAAAALVAPGAANAAATVTTELKGPGTVVNGKTAVYTATLSNLGPDTITTPSLNVRVTGDPATRAEVTGMRFTGGYGTWSCSFAICRLLGGSIAPGQSAGFQFSAKITGDAEIRFLVAGAGIVVTPRIGPGLLNLTVPARVAKGSTPTVSFFLPQAASVTAVAERYGRLWRITRTRLGANGRLRTTSKVSCLFKRPRAPKSSALKAGERFRARRGKPCRKRTGGLLSVPLTRGNVAVQAPLVGALKLGGTYKLVATPRGPDGALGPAVRSGKFKIVR